VDNKWNLFLPGCHVCGSRHIPAKTGNNRHSTREELIPQKRHRVRKPPGKGESIAVDAPWERKFGDINHLGETVWKKIPLPPLLTPDNKER
jgi:hypothetical protein